MILQDAFLSGVLLHPQISYHDKHEAWGWRNIVLQDGSRESTDALLRDPVYFYVFFYVWIFKFKSFSYNHSNKYGLRYGIILKRDF